MTIVKNIIDFSSGELSPWLDGRTDLQKYAAGCRRLDNFIPLPQGGLMKRPGLQKVGFIHQPVDTPDPNFGLLIEFQITTHSSVMLALGGGKMKFVDKGRMIKTGPGSTTDHSINIPWDDLDLRKLRWKQINDVMFIVHPAYEPRILTREGPVSWTLKPMDVKENPPLLDENIRKSRRITTSFTVESPVFEDIPVWGSTENYPAGSRVTRDGKVWICRCNTGPGYAGDTDGVGARTPGGDGTFVDDDDDGVTKKVWVKSFSDTSSEVRQVMTLSANVPIFREGHVGSVWEIAHRRGRNRWEVSLAAKEDAGSGGAAEDEEEDEAVTSKELVVQGGWDFITFGFWSGKFTIEVSTDKGESWKTIRTFRSSASKPRNASTEGHEEKRVLMRIRFEPFDFGWPESAGGGTPPYARLSAREDRIRGLVKILSFSNAYQVTARTIAPVELGETSLWAEGAWSGHQGYPRCVELHQNRLLMAATERKPHSIWGSAVDDYQNFHRGTEADQPWMHTLAIGTRDPILWMHSDRLLIVGNGAGEYTLRGEDEDGPLTPEYGAAIRHSSFGTHNGGVGCIISDTVSMYVQNGGRAIREMAYTFQSDRYESSNLNLLADHLFKGAVQDVAIQRQPFQIIWVVASGRLFSLTYERSQGVVAWARHTTGGEVVSVGSVRRYAEDLVYILVRREREDGVKLVIERLTPGGFLEPKDDGTWCDSHTVIPSAEEAAEGLGWHHLRGREVVGFQGKKLLGPARLDENFFKGLKGPVRIGLPYTSVVQPMTPEEKLGNGTTRTRECRIHAVVPSLYKSRGGSFGESPAKLDPLEVGSDSGTFTGEVERNFDGRHDPRGRFCIASTENRPFAIRSVVLKLAYHGDES